MSPYWRRLFFLDLDWHPAGPQTGCPRRCAVGPIVFGSLHILDLLSAWPAATDISGGPEGAGQASHSGRAAGSGRSRRSQRPGDATPSATFFAAEQLAVGSVRCEDF